MVGETSQHGDVATNSEQVTKSNHTWCGGSEATPEWQRVRAGPGTGTAILQGGSGTKLKVSEWRRRVSTGVKGQRLLVERLAQLKTSTLAPCLGTGTSGRRRASVPLGPCGTRGGVGTHTVTHTLAHVRSKPAVRAHKSTEGLQGASMLRGVVDTHTHSHSHSHTHTNTRAKVSVDKPWRSKPTAVIRPWVGPHHGDATSTGSTLPPIQGSSFIPPTTTVPDTRATPRSSAHFGKVKQPEKNGTPKACVLSTPPGAPKMYVISTGTPRPHRKLFRTQEVGGGQMFDARVAFRRSSECAPNAGGRSPLECVAPRRVSACWNWRPEESYTTATHSQTHNQTNAAIQTHTATSLAPPPSRPLPVPPSHAPPAPPPVNGSPATHSAPPPPTTSPPLAPPSGLPASDPPADVLTGSSVRHSLPPVPPPPPPVSPAVSHPAPLLAAGGSKTPASPEAHLQYPRSPGGGQVSSPGTKPVGGLTSDKVSCAVQTGQVSSPGKPIGGLTSDKVSCAVQTGQVNSSGKPVGGLTGPKPAQVRSAPVPYRTRGQVQLCSHDSAIETDSQSSGASGSDEDEDEDEEEGEEEEEYYTDERIGEWVVKVNACLFSPSDSASSFDSQLEEEDVDTIKIVYGQD